MTVEEWAEGDEAGGIGSAWRGADESLCDLVAEAPPVPPRLLASHRIWTAGGQGVCAATVLWAAGGRAARAAPISRAHDDERDAILLPARDRDRFRPANLKPQGG